MRYRKYKYKIIPTKYYVDYDEEFIFFVSHMKRTLLEKFLEKHPGKYKVITTSPDLFIDYGFSVTSTCEEIFFMEN